MDDALSNPPPAIDQLKKKLEAGRKAIEALEYSKAAITDAVMCDDGLDGADGEAVVKMIDEATQLARESGLI